MEQNRVKRSGEPKKEDFGSPVFLGRQIALPDKALRVRIDVIPKGTKLHRLSGHTAMGQIIQKTAEQLGLILTEE
ncbi:TPA: hypothetical protein ACKP1B_003437 [Serratia fonticola]